MKEPEAVGTDQRSYQVVSPQDSHRLAELLAQDGQCLRPLLDLVSQTQGAVTQLMAAVGRAAIEAVLIASAQEVAGPRHPGRQGANAIGWHGRQEGVVCMDEAKLRVSKPRLRRKGGGVGAEVEVPAYAAMQDDQRVGQRMLELLLRGVSTRNYHEVLPQMAQTVGVAKSSVSRQAVEASAAQLQTLMERRWDDKDILILYLDGLIFGPHTVLLAVGVDSAGDKHILGLTQGASENAAACRRLLEDLVARGVTPGRRRLFVIDGSKALRAAVDAVYGPDNPVQRCRAHKRRNVLEQLPKSQRPTDQAALQAAYRLEADQGQSHLEQLAQMYEKQWPQAAASLREGLAETFTINRLNVPPTLRRALATTNLIESPHSGTRLRTRHVSRWQDAAMVLRWTASAYLAIEQHFKKIMGYAQLWMLQAYLDAPVETTAVASPRKVG
jgi:putative transposase